MIPKCEYSFIDRQREIDFNFGKSIVLYKLGLNVSIAEIKSKFNNLRTTFLVQHRKYLSSLKSGSGSDDIDRPSLWYYKDILFVAEHCMPRPSKDSLSITSLNNQDNGWDQDNLNYDENERMDIENNVFDPTELSISLDTDRYELDIQEDSTDELEIPQQKRINIQNIETIRTPNIATRLSRPSSISTDMATPSTSRTHSESSSGKKKKRKKSTDDGNFFMSKASNALTTLTNVLARDDNPKPVEISLPKKTSMRTFSEFVESQLEFLMGDEELLLETQQEILTTIWAARKKKLQK
ncbi:hypothetical protein ABEB36_010765 [Hypothenemus hampei]|uniref:MADF domain-containing protein n=1 Tax=Hypothenemus hampei TaxID=57062 RepID=A0ABD1ED21_HYPHA